MWESVGFCKMVPKERIELPTSDERKKKIFDFIDDLLQKTGKIGEYDQKI